VHTGQQIAALASASKVHERDLLSACMCCVVPILHSYTQYVQSTLAQYANGIAVESPSIIDNVLEIERSIDAIYDEAMEV